LEELENSAYRNELEDCEENVFNQTKIETDCVNFNNCNGHGICKNGQCICDAGWTNYDCSISNIELIRFMS
jgi:hypothetical protein